MNSIETILAHLAAMQGMDAVRAACRRFVLGKISIPLDSSIADLSDVESSISSSAPAKAKAKGKRGRPSKDKKAERKPRGQTSWNKLVAETLKEMQDAYKAEHPDISEKDLNKAVPYKLAFEEAGKRKRASDPEAQKKYEEAKAKKSKEFAKQEFPPLPPSGKTSQTMRTGAGSGSANDE